MRIYGIDPGPTKSAACAWDTQKSAIVDMYLGPSEELIGWLRSRISPGSDIRVAVEQIRAYGMRVGNEVFDTAWWSGRFFETAAAAGVDCTMCPRLHVKVHHAGTARSGDKEIREALIRRLGAPGTKKEPGRTFNVRADIWAALAVALYVADKLEQAPRDAAVPAGEPKRNQ